MHQPPDVVSLANSQCLVLYRSQSSVVLSISYAGDPKGDVELTTYKVSLMLIVAATFVAVTNAAYVKVCTY